MAIRKLGRGLDVLIPNRPPAAAKGREVLSIPVGDIAPNPYQPRKSFPDADLQDLAASIRRDGVLQPVLVRRVDGGYQLISGERRVRAARLAQLSAISAIVLDVDDRKAQELALIENLQREDLNPLEAAEGLQSLITKYGVTQDQLAEALGMKRSSIANALRLLDLPEKVKKGLSTGEISAGHAKVLLSLDSPELQVEYYKRIRTEGLSVRALEQLTAAQVDARKNRKKTPAKSSDPHPQTAALQDELTRLLGTKVTIVHNHHKGVIHVHFYSQEEFERLRDLFRSAARA